MIRKLLIFLVFALLVCTACSRGAEPPRQKGETASPRERIEKHLNNLTDPEMSGRRVGTKGEAKAALYLAQHMQRLGLKPVGDAGTYFQSFPVGEIGFDTAQKRMTLRHTAQKEVTQSDNVLGMLPGSSENIILISAHYDHLGLIEGEFYPGANDNASGVALVMELAESLHNTLPVYTILFCFWGGEEAGLLGSTFFCGHPTVPLERISCILNLDSIGNLQRDQRLLIWKSCENETSKRFEERLRQEGWETVWEENTCHNSDHWPFAREGIPGFTLLSPYWLEENHTPEDTPDKVKVELLLKLREAVLNTLY